jgi:hypothetical protein
MIVIRVVDGSGKLDHALDDRDQGGDHCSFSARAGGNFAMAFEEGAYSVWIYDLIAPYVAEDGGL